MDTIKNKMAGILPALNQHPKAQEILNVMPKAIAFDVDGESFLVVMTDGKMQLAELKTGIEPEIVIEGNSDEMAKFVSRTKDISHVVAEGSVRITKGRLSRVILFDRLLSLQRR